MKMLVWVIGRVALISLKVVLGVSAFGTGGEDVPVGADDGRSIEGA